MDQDISSMVSQNAKEEEVFKKSQIYNALCIIIKTINKTVGFVIVSYT